MCFRRILSLVIFVSALAGCLAPPRLATQEPAIAPSGAAEWPTQNWQIATPESQGLDSQMLARMLETVEQRKLKLHSLLIVRNGYLVSETYFSGHNANRKHELYSITKSVISALVGIAIDKGAIAGINQKALEFFPNQSFANTDERKRAITIENLLTMTTGLDWQEGDAAYRALYQSQDWAAHVLDLPMISDPGASFNYCTGCSHVLSAILHQKTGMPTQKYAEEMLFDHIGIDQFSWSSDASGNAIGGWGLQITPRQMAKLGYLYLQNGQWDGQQIVPQSWVEKSTQVQVQTGYDIESAYGYQWWILPRLNGYAALGRGGQTIFILPDENLIVVTTAETDGHLEIFDLIEKFIIPAIGHVGD